MIGGAVRGVIDRLIPLCNDFLFLRHFVDNAKTFDYGLVYHAFAESVDVILKDYLVFVAKVEEIGAAQLNFQVCLVFFVDGRICICILSLRLII